MPTCRTLCTLFVAIASVFAACRPTPADDVFARAFVEQLRHRDAAGAAALEPGGMLVQVGWDSVQSLVGGNLPTGSLDSVRLVSWETGNDRAGTFRKLTYYLYRGREHATVWLWLVERGGRRYINTVQTAALAPNNP